MEVILQVKVDLEVMRFMEYVAKEEGVTTEKLHESILIFWTNAASKQLKKESDGSQAHG